MIVTIVIDFEKRCGGGGGPRKFDATKEAGEEDKEDDDDDKKEADGIVFLTQNSSISVANIVIDIDDLQ